MRTALILAVLLLTTSSAAAWDGPELWYERADAASPGGGGIFGTGGQRDHRITCLDCHVDRVETSLALDFQFQPALGTSAGDATYVPGQRYRIDVTMQGETLVPPCDPYMLHINNFAAAFENDTGQIVGVLESDSGQSAAACPAQYPRPTAGTTALYRDCQTIFSKGDENRTTWAFFWTAPSSGGTVRLHYGVVDGDCMMSSLGDAAIAARRTLVPAPAAAASRDPLDGETGGCQAGPTPPSLALLLMIGALLLRMAPRPSRATKGVRVAAMWLVSVALSVACGGTPAVEVDAAFGADAPDADATADAPAVDGVMDDFERGALGPDWTIVFPPSPPNDQVRIIAGSDLGMGPGPQGFFLVNYIGRRFAADQFGEATIPTDVDPQWLHQVYVRWRASDAARYGFGYNGDPAQPSFGTWYFKYDGVPGAQTRVFATAAAPMPPQPGDRIRVEVVGYTLKGFWNGSLVLEATDTDPSRISDGVPGLAARWANGNTSTATEVKVWESWSGGSL